MSWKNPPAGAGMPTASALRAMDSDTRYNRVADMAEDAVCRIDEEIMELIRVAGGTPYDYQLALALMIRSMSRQMLGTVTSTALGNGDLEEARDAPQKVVGILQTFASEIAEVEVEEIDLNGEVPEDLAALVKDKIRTSGLRITDMKVVRVGGSFTIMAQGSRE